MSAPATGGASIDTLRRKLLFRAWHRGTREMDLLLGRYAEASLAAMDSAALTEFEQLLEAPDPELFAWLTEARPLPANFDTPSYRALKAFHTHGRPLHA